MFWRLFIGDDLQLCTIFNYFYTLPDGASTEYQISNREFSDFLRIIVILCTTCIAREVFSPLVVMGNGNRVLPVLH